MDITIAPLTESDLDGAAAAIASGMIFRRYGSDPETARANLARQTDQRVVARVGGETVGVAVFQVTGTMPLSGYLHMLAVHERWRSQGIGRVLLKYVEAEAFRRGPNLFLYCTADNFAAQRFYEREGYQKIGIVPNFILAGIDEILYRKTLGPMRGYQPPTL